MSKFESLKLDQRENWWGAGLVRTSSTTGLTTVWPNQKIDKNNMLNNLFRNFMGKISSKNQVTDLNISGGPQREGAWKLKFITIGHITEFSSRECSKKHNGGQNATKWDNNDRTLWKTSSVFHTRLSIANTETLPQILTILKTKQKETYHRLSRLKTQYTHSQRNLNRKCRPYHCKVLIANTS